MGGQSSGDSTAYLQLYSLVQDLVKEVKALKQKPGPPRLSAEANTILEDSKSNLPSREEIFDQFREFREREKRVDSIIIRGMGVGSLVNIKGWFDEICRYLGLQPIELTGLKSIGNNTIYRARILDSQKRRDLLAKSVELRNSDQFKRIYINRDLTYLQRQDVINRRKAALRPAPKENVGSSLSSVQTDFDKIRPIAGSGGDGVGGVGGLVGVVDTGDTGSSVIGGETGSSVIGSVRGSRRGRPRGSTRSRRGGAGRGAGGPDRVLSVLSQGETVAGNSLLNTNPLNVPHLRRNHVLN